MTPAWGGVHVDRAERARPPSASTQKTLPLPAPGANARGELAGDCHFLLYTSPHFPNSLQCAWGIFLIRREQ